MAAPMIRSPLTLFTAASAAAALLTLTGCKSTGEKEDGTKAAAADLVGDLRPAAEKTFYAACSKAGELGGAVAGRDGWNFAGDEMLQLSRATSTNVAVAAIADYAQQLRSQNIDLIVVPVPPKTLVYPDKIGKGVKVPGKAKRPERMDSVFKQAMDSLEAKRVKVVDLLPVFIAHREDKAGTVFPRTCNTWSPYGVQIAVKEIAAAVRDSKAGGRGAVTGITTEPLTLTFTGRLATDPKAKAEQLPASRIGRITDGKLKSLSFNTGGGSLMLMGGPDILAWREGNNPQGSNGAFCSLAEQLSAELQTIPDVLANSSDGRNAPRLRILRERTNGHGMLGSTRTLVWIIPALDLAGNNWQRVPLQLQFSEGGPDIQLR